MPYPTPTPPVKTNFNILKDVVTRISCPEYLGATKYTWTCPTLGASIVSSSFNHAHVLVSPQLSSNVILRVQIEGDFSESPLQLSYTLYPKTSFEIEDGFYVDFYNDKIEVAADTETLEDWGGLKITFNLLEKDTVKSSVSFKDFKYDYNMGCYYYDFPMPVGYNRSDFSVQKVFTNPQDLSGKGSATSTAGLGSGATQIEVIKDLVATPTMTGSKITQLAIEATLSLGVPDWGFRGYLTLPYTNTQVQKEFAFTLVGGKLKASVDLSDYQISVDSSLTQDASNAAVAHSSFSLQISFNGVMSPKIYTFTPLKNEIPCPRASNSSIKIASPFKASNSDFLPYFENIVDKWLYETYGCYPLHFIDMDAVNPSYGNDNYIYYVFSTGIYQKRMGEGRTFFAKGKIPFLISIQDSFSHHMSNVGNYTISPIQVQVKRSGDLVATLSAQCVNDLIFKTKLTPGLLMEDNYLYFIVEVDFDSYGAGHYYLDVDFSQFPRFLGGTSIQLNNGISVAYSSSLQKPAPDLEISLTTDLTSIEKKYKEIPINAVSNTKPTVWAPFWIATSKVSGQLDWTLYGDLYQIPDEFNQPNIRKLVSSTPGVKHVGFTITEDSVTRNLDYYFDIMPAQAVASEFFSGNILNMMDGVKSFSGQINSNTFIPNTSLEFGSLGQDRLIGKRSNRIAIITPGNVSSCSLVTDIISKNPNLYIDAVDSSLESVYAQMTQNSNTVTLTSEVKPTLIGITSPDNQDVDYSINTYLKPYANVDLPWGSFENNAYSYFRTDSCMEGTTYLWEILSPSDAQALNPHDSTVTVFNGDSNLGDLSLKVTITLPNNLGSATSGVVTKTITPTHNKLVSLWYRYFSSSSEVPSEVREQVLPDNGILTLNSTYLTTWGGFTLNSGETFRPVLQIKNPSLIRKIDHTLFVLKRGTTELWRKTTITNSSSVYSAWFFDSTNNISVTAASLFTSDGVSVQKGVYTLTMEAWEDAAETKRIFLITHNLTVN